MIYMNETITYYMNVQTPLLTKEILSGLLDHFQLNTGLLLCFCFVFFSHVNIFFPAVKVTWTNHGVLLLTPNIQIGS